MDQQLLVFVTVVEEGNFSRAAKNLHMTQPAVSQYIQSLERTFNVKLLDRSNKYVRLNKAGEIVYHHAKEILGLYSKMGGLIEDLSSKANGSLSIGASYTFGEYILPHLIAKMQENYPLITPTITIGNTNDIAELVSGHQLDVGIIEGHFEDKNLQVEPFAKDSMYVVTAARHNVERVNLAEHAWIVREVGSGTREAQELILKDLEITPKRVMEFGSTQLIKESVEAGLGISLLSHWAIQKELSLGTLKQIEIEGTPFKREFSIVLRTSFKTKALEVFLKLLKDNRYEPE